MMADIRKTMYDIERCICHVPDACRDCSHYGQGEAIGCMENLLKDAYELLKAQPQIVRCKDCKHGCISKDETGQDIVECFQMYRTRKLDWFCADGEPKG